MKLTPAEYNELRAAFTDSEIVIRDGCGDTYWIEIGVGGVDGVITLHQYYGTPTGTLGATAFVARIEPDGGIVWRDYLANKGRDGRDVADFIFMRTLRKVRDLAAQRGAA